MLYPSTTELARLLKLPTEGMLSLALAVQLHIIDGHQKKRKNTPASVCCRFDLTLCTGDDDDKNDETEET